MKQLKTCRDGELHYLINHFPMHRRITYHAFLPHLLTPCFKLRLNQAYHFTAILQQLPDRRQHFGKGNKGYIYGYEGGRFLYVLRRHIADIGPLHADDPLIIPQLPVQLAMPHINGINLCRPVLKHAVCKSSGGASHIHADTPLQLQAEGIHCLRQLQAAPAHIGDRIALHYYTHSIRKHASRFILSLSVHQHFAGHDDSSGLLPGRRKPQTDHHNIQSFFHPQSSCPASSC